MLRALVALLILVYSSGLASGEEGSYRINPGDTLDISIWRDENMHREVVVLPDGSISYPLAGHLMVAGLTLQEVESEIVGRLKKGQYYQDPTVNVSVLETEGNQIFVIGEVKSPGAFAARRRLDVMQALSLAGGLTEFADENDILVLRRNKNEQITFKFNYSKVQSGRNLSSNIVLESGDTVVVPTSGIF